MRLFRKKDGFTLIELLIVILTGTIVTAAATTILLLAMRINRKSLDTVERQSIMRIIQSVFEDMGSDGDYEFTDNAIKTKGSTDDYVIKYDEQGNSIVTGQDAVLMDDVTAFHLLKTDTPFKYVRGLYTFSIESKGETYVSSVYGRAQDDAWFADDPALDYESARNQLVDIAASQIGSVGEIQPYKNLIAKDKHYNLWYLDREINEGYIEGWSDDTAWCSVFVSWVLEQTTRFGTKLDENSTLIPYVKDVPKRANVNYLWLETYAWYGEDNLHIYGDGYIPQPGDLIFFTKVKEHPYEDLYALRNLGSVLPIGVGEDAVEIVRKEIWREKQNLYIHNDHVVGVPTEEACFSLTQTESWNEQYSILKHLLGVPGSVDGVHVGLDHVGIVAEVTDDYVYTIEGNVILGDEEDTDNIKQHSVMLRKFPLDNSNNTGKYHIFGYATLNWNPAYK